jgi:hypothetical protein
MSWADIDRMFHRSFVFSFSKKKFFFTFPIVAFCGIFISLFRSLSEGAGGYARLSLSFFPVFVVTTLLFAAGVVLVRCYYKEVKNSPFSLRKLAKSSWNLMVSSLYLIAPIPLAYVSLWTVVGLFYLLKEIPFLGFFIGLLLSFVPFLLVLSFIILAGMNIGALFWITPSVALRSECNFDLVISRLQAVRKRISIHIVLLILALLPVAAILGLLFLAGTVSGSVYVVGSCALSKFAQMSVTSLAFSALCVPVVIFFFNFSAEAYALTAKLSPKESK